MSDFLSENVLVVLDRVHHRVLKYQLMEEYPNIGIYLLKTKLIFTRICICSVDVEAPPVSAHHQALSSS